ncbi:hypothetical protein DB346_18230 [Verrucomicrobia bacterium LW23]|nr:hypothetical protein DB346_18230 [Verrucomicrobia bacterium LW23]
MKLSLPRLLLAVSLAAAFSVTPLTMLRAEPGHVFAPLKGEELAKIAAALPESARAKPAKPRKILLFYRTEGFVHSSIAHANETFKQLGEKTGAFTVSLSEDMAAFEPDNLKQFDAVLLNNTTGLRFDNPAHRQALLDFVVKEGKGLIGIHAATDNFGKWPEGQALMGGTFKGHPWNAGDVSAIKLDEPDHPVVKSFGGKGFWLREEIYQIAGPYGRDKQRVLLSLDMSKAQNRRDPAKIHRTDNDFPIAWIKKTEAGRVFYSSLGHNPDVFWQPEIVQHFLDGIQFALGDLPADAIPSAHLITQPVPALAPDTPLPLQDVPRKPTADQCNAWLKALMAYDIGGDRHAVAAYQEYLRFASPDERAAAEAELLPVLQSNATPFGARDMTCRWLTLIGSAKAVPVLENLLSDEKMAGPAVYALTEIPGAEADAAILTGLEKAPAAIRPALIDAAARRKTAAAVPILARLADGSEAAINALGAIGTLPALEALVALKPAPELESARDWALIAAAGSNAASTSPDAAKRARDMLKALAHNAKAEPTMRISAASRSVLAAGEQALGVLLPMLHDSDARVAAGAARLLPHATGSEVADAIPAVLPKLPPSLQVLVIQSFAAKGGADALAVARVGLASDQESVRVPAIQALASVGNATFVEHLVGLLEQRNAEEKAAGEALRRMTDPAVAEQLRAALAQSQGPTRAALLLIVADRLDLASGNIAITACTDDSADVRTAACAAMEKLAREHDLPRLIELLNTSLKPNERKSLEKALMTSSRAFRDADQPAETFQLALSSAAPEVRRILIIGLASLGSPKASAALGSMLQDPEVDARKEVIRALSSSRAPFAVSLLIGAAKAGKEPSERILALRGYLDTVQDLPSSGDAKVDLYKAAWPLAERDEEREVILAALKKMNNTKSRKLLETLEPKQDPTSPQPKA